MDCFSEPGTCTVIMTHVIALQMQNTNYTLSLWHSASCRAHFPQRTRVLVLFSSSKINIHPLTVIIYLMDWIHICSMLIELHLYKYFFLPDATLCFCSICYRPYVTFQSWFYSLAFASTQQIFIYTSYQLNEIPKMGKNDNNIIFSYFFVFRKSDGEIIIFASKCDIANEYFHILDITTQRFIFDTVF